MFIYKHTYLDIQMDTHPFDARPRRITNSFVITVPMWQIKAKFIDPKKEYEWTYKEKEVDKNGADSTTNNKRK